MSEYTELLAKLAAQRLTLATAKEMKTAMVKTFEETPSFQAIQNNITAATAQVDELSVQLRELAIHDYWTTGSKKPHPAMGIRVTTVLEYGPSEAEDWARINLPAALTLNKSVFETYAKTMAKVNPVPFVFIDDKPTATIATDLSEYLKEAK
jgi:hypothetical protein